MSTSSTESLEPLQQALLRRANATAEDTRAEAQRQASAAIDRARQDAAATLSRARTDGEADAAQRRAEDEGRARRTARGIVLAAQRAVYDELRTQARAAAGELLADPDQHRRLVTLLRTLLGPGAVVRDHPMGGVIGEAPDGRRIDASVDMLVERALTDLDLEPLWAPR